LIDEIIFIYTKISITGRRDFVLLRELRNNKAEGRFIKVSTEQEGFIERLQMNDSK